MPEAVVDGLEPVDVDEEHRERVTVASGVRRPLGEVAVESAPVVQAGERVLRGELAQALLVAQRPGERAGQEVRERRAGVPGLDGVDKPHDVAGVGVARIDLLVRPDEVDQLREGGVEHVELEAGRDR